MAALHQSVRDLETLAANDAAVRPLALLQAEVLRSVADLAWDASAANLGPGHVSMGKPLLHGQMLLVVPQNVRALLQRLVNVAERAGIAGADNLRTALVGGWRSTPTIDPISFLAASITWDQQQMEQMAATAQVDLPLLTTLGQLAVVPLLLACGRRATTLMPNIPWKASYCPLCGAWPTLAEIRGLERQRWLCCGRCGTSWRLRHQECVFCGNNEHRSLGYLAPDAEKESRRAVTCNRCRGYIKTFATVAALTPPELILRDLSSVELDMAALKQGYSSPERPAFPLSLDLMPASRDKSGWLPWLS